VGFGENSRVLNWVYDRGAERVCGVETLIGVVPGEGELDLQGLDVGPEGLAALTRVEVEGWLLEILNTPDVYAGFGERMPS
jgi:phosphoenolpyruvate carboxykinase (GTP)